MAELETPIADDVLIGIAAIGAFIGEDDYDRTYRLLTRKVIPAGKRGRHWIASKRTLRAHYERVTGGSSEAA